MDSPHQNNSMNLQDHAWRYFEFHANQRITLFRFYIAILVFYSIAIGYLFIRFYQDGKLSETGVILSSIAFIFLTRIFQLLDHRNRELIKYAKAALREIESNTIPGNSTVKIFNLENKDTIDNNPVTHNECFTCLYRLAYGASVVAIIAAIVSLFYFPATG